MIKLYSQKDWEEIFLISKIWWIEWYDFQKKKKWKIDFRKNKLKQIKNMQSFRYNFKKGFTELFNQAYLIIYYLILLI